MQMGLSTIMIFTKQLYSNALHTGNQKESQELYEMYKNILPLSFLVKFVPLAKPLVQPLQHTK